METSSFRILTALTAREAPQLVQRPVTPVWLCYQVRSEPRVRSGPRLWRREPPQKIRGGVLAAQDSPGLSPGDPEVCCIQAVRECRERQAEGLWANWSQPPSPALNALTAALDRALLAEGLTLYVNEPFGDCAPNAQVFLSSALSAGTLRLRLEEAQKRWGNRVALAVERMAEDFTLPALDGQGQSLSPARLEALRRQYAPRVHCSPEFCASYFTYAQKEQTHLVLFDRTEDLVEKLRLARSLGIERVLLAWQETGAACLDALTAEFGQFCPQ